MRTQASLAILSAALLGQVTAEDAQPISGNPPGVTYKAVLSGKPFFSEAAVSGEIQGSITAAAPADGNGIQFKVLFDNLPAEGGPFIYHIHVDPVVDGNCTGTLGHLDPFERGDKPACDATAPQTCQVGDLSGKHGKVYDTPFNAEYIDHFVSSQENTPPFFGNRSFVIHYANGTRLACANFADLGDSATPSSSSPICTNSTQPPTHSATSRPSSGVTGTGAPTSATAPPTIVPFPGAASISMVSIPLMAGVMSLLFLAM